MRLLPLALLLAACDSFTPASVIESLRVIAIRSDPAEVASGAEATLRSLVIDLDPAAAGRTITYEWALCTKRPTAGYDVDPACFDADTADFLVPLPALPGGTTKLTMPPHTVTDFGPPDSTTGFYVPVRLRVRAGNAVVTAFHRLRWEAGFVPPNQNPTIAGISYIKTESDGQLPDMGQTVDVQPLPDDTMPPMPLQRGGKLRFRASDAPGSSEMYTALVGDPRDMKTATFTERVRFFWYSSAGKVSPDVTGEERPDTVLDTSKFDTSIDARNGLVDLWLVGVDERGGVDWLHRQLELTR